MTRAIITAGTGFLALQLTEKLLKEHYEITLFYDPPSGMESNISGFINNIELIRSDIGNFDYSEHFDLLVNLASRASRVEWKTYPVEVAPSNSLGNINLIKLVLKNKSLYIYAFSSEVYGDSNLVPTPELFMGKVSTIGFRTPYDEGKRFREAFVKAYDREYGLKNIIIRLFSTSGQRISGGDLYWRVMNRFIQQAIRGEHLTVYSKGTHTRSFTYASDRVNAILLLIRKGSSGDIYNAGNGHETAIIDLARLILKITMSTSELKFIQLPPFDRREDP